MAIAFNAQSSSETGSGTSLSFAHNAGTGDNRYLIVVVSQWNNGGTRQTPSATYGGQAMSVLVDVPGNDAEFRFTMLGLANPPSGNNNVVVTRGGSGSIEIVAGAASFTGVDPDDPTGDTAQEAATGNNASSQVLNGTLDTAVDDWVVDGVADYDSNETPGANQTVRMSNDNGSDANSVFISTKVATTTSTSMQWTVSEASADTCGWAAVVLHPVAEASTGEIDLDTLDASPTFHATTIQGTVHLAHLDASASFAAPTVAAASVDLEAFDASPTFHDPTIAAASVDLAHLDASATFHDPTLFDNSVQLGHLDASATFHTLSVSGSVTLDALDASATFFDTEVAGYVDLDHLDASATFFAPTVGATSIDLDALDASPMFFDPTVVGAGDVVLDLLDASATFHTLVVAATSIDLPHLDASPTFQTLTVIPVLTHRPGVGETEGGIPSGQAAGFTPAGVAAGDRNLGRTTKPGAGGATSGPAGEGGT